METPPQKKPFWGTRVAIRPGWWGGVPTPHPRGNLGGKKVAFLSLGKGGFKTPDEKKGAPGGIFPKGGWGAPPGAPRGRGLREGPPEIHRSVGKRRSTKKGGPRHVPRGPPKVGWGGHHPGGIASKKGGKKKPPF